MVYQKKLCYGSSCQQIAAMPQVPKSAKGKRSIRKKVEGNQMCAFDLLATVAGNLLFDGNSACSQDTISTLNLSTTNVAVKQLHEVDKGKSASSNNFGHQSNIRNILRTEVIYGQQTDNKVKDDSLLYSTATSASNSGFVKSKEENCSVVSAESLCICNKVDVRSHITDNTEKCLVVSNTSVSVESHESKGEGKKTPLEAEHQFVLNVFNENNAKTKTSVDAMDLDHQPPLASLDRSVEVPLCTINSHPGSFQRGGVQMELSVDKDDDENSSGCTDCSIPNNKTSRQQQIVDDRLSKPLALKYLKVASRIKRDGRFFNYDIVPKSGIHNKRMSYSRQRKQRSSFKRRKMIEHYSGLKYVGGLPTLCRKNSLKLIESDFQESKPEANAEPSSTSRKKSTYESSDYYVKLKIKSFKVPELHIDIPETATVGSLKQSILEAVTAILQGGLHVGVLLQGRKVRDDNKTLRQAGISQVNELDSLDFMLEPNPSKTPLASIEDPDSLDITDDAELLSRMASVPPATVNQIASDSTMHPALTFCHESDHDSVHSPNDSLLLNKTESDSRELVAVSPLNDQTLAVVPLRKSRRSEVAQRRIRRPFTVTEVEALVEAVELLGTGRWRDVKLRAFDNAKHRTYVDLKDKWKTLVHTAKISPQQRRGEPVPQELLDRVLSAHAFWSHQQARLQIKSPSHQGEPLSPLF